MDSERDRAFDIAPVAVTDPDAAWLLREYFAELAGRYYGRPCLPGEVAAAMAESPSGDLRPPTGLMLIARRQDQPAGCAGLRVLAPQVIEVTRVFVHPDFRKRGLALRLLSELEPHARDLGATTLRLGTRHDLVEAISLYGKHGYHGIPRYPDADSYDDRWFEKPLPR